MGRIVYIVGTGVGMTVERFCKVHASDLFLIELVKQIPEKLLEDKTLTLHNCSTVPYDILTVPENFTHHYHEKINSLPYHRRTRRSD
ncbi:MAG TPA: hypothetical protein P5188_12235, partial [Flavobacterium sp.]|nr:hypothetical protein [Flavobacterium sp.]